MRKASRKTLKAGMTVAYELMFAVDQDGFYLEDMVLVEGRVRRAY